MNGPRTEIAAFGGGCFWCTEAVFLMLQGVQAVTSGYAGGTTPSPTYDQVSSGTTGHAEVIEVAYDPAVIPFRRLLDVFFAAHDPTTPNRQGADVGIQYRSIILYSTAEQKADAEAVIREFTAAKKFPLPIVTEVKPLERFWPAEGYHQDFYAKNPAEPYAAAVITPKIKKTKKEFSRLLKATR